MEKEVQFNRVTIHNKKYEATFVSADVIDLSSHHLSKNKVFLPSRRLKFVATLKNINKANIKEEIEVSSRKLKLIWHFSE